MNIVVLVITTFKISSGREHHNVPNSSKTLCERCRNRDNQGFFKKFDLS